MRHRGKISASLKILHGIDWQHHALLLACKLLLAVGAALLISPQLQALPIITLDEGFTQEQLGLELEYRFDATGSLNIETIQAIEDEESWQVSKKKTINFGFKKETLWLRFQIEDRRSVQTDSILRLNYPQSDSIEVYDVQGQDVKIFRAGDRLLKKEWAMDARVPAFPLSPARSRTLYIKIHSQSSLQVPLILSTAEDYHRETMAEEIAQALYYGALIAIGVYNLLLFIGTGLFVYGYYIMFLFFYSLYQATPGGIGYHYFWRDWINLNDTMVFLGIGGTAIASIRFTISLLNLKRFSKIPMIALVYQAVAMVVSFGVYFAFGYATAVKFEILALVCPWAMTMIYAGVLGVKQRQRAARWYVIAWSVFVVGIIITALRVLGMFPSNNFTLYAGQIGSAAEFILLSFALADRIKQMSDSLLESNIKLEKSSLELKEINENLEGIVEEKTQEVKSILDHIPQGVFLIENNLKISSNYSAHLPDLLQATDIAGRSISEVLLDHTSLSTDAKDRIIQSLHSIIDADEISFEINASNLPAELAFTDSQGKNKIFSMTWNVELDQSGVVKKVLVTILDSTQTKEFEKEIVRQQSEMRFVRELIECGANKFAQLVGTVGPLLEENARLINLAVPDDDTIKIMFVNAHTAKGAARTLGLSVLSNSIHEAEHTYSETIKHAIPIDHNRMRSEMKVVQDTFSHYISVNRDTLDRKDDLTKVQVDKQFLAEHCALMFKLEQTHRLGPNDHIGKIARTSLDQIIKLIYKGLPFVMEDCFIQSSRIARDLGKPVPKLKLDIVDLPILQNIEDILRRISVHIIRNALDHGIELPDERILSGKQAAGLLTVNATSTDSQLQIFIQDDGRGLAIGKLREKGLRDGSLQNNATLHQIANTIFESGVSTSQTVSHLSGRGIGMSAIKVFVEEAGGTIEIILENPNDSSAEYYAFKIKITFPLSEVGLALAS